MTVAVVVEMILELRTIDKIEVENGRFQMGVVRLMKQDNLASSTFPEMLKDANGTQENASSVMIKRITITGSEKVNTFKQ
jgi:hypothetical protein